MKNMCLVVVIASLFVSEVYTRLISDTSSDFNLDNIITSCKFGDFQCMKRNAESAIPIVAAGIKGISDPLDPLSVDALNADLPNLNLKFTDLEFKGLKDCTVLNISRREETKVNSPKSTLFMTFMCTLEISGYYDMEGKLLIFPVKGNGRTTLTLNKFAIKLECFKETLYGNTSQLYWRILECLHKISLRDKANIEFTNLNKANDTEDANLIYQWINNSPNDIVMEISPAIIESMVSKIIFVLNQFLSVIDLHIFVNY